VAVCSAQHSGCTEFIDPANTVGGSGEDGTSYYVLKNDALFRDVASCNGQASQKEGCVLFEDTSNPNKPYDSVVTYQNSETINYGLVDIVQTDPTQGDTNTLIKVGRDRQCSEWLSCRSAVTVTTETNSKVTLCQEYDACNQLNNDGTCGNWVRTTTDIARLTEDKYIARDVSWEAAEYSGYSLYNKFNPADYVYIFTEDSNDAFVAYQVPDSVFVLPDDAPAADKTSALALGCFEQSGGQYVKSDGEACGVDNGGRCYSQKCLYPIDGNFTFSYTDDNNGQDEAAVTKNLSAIAAGLDKASCKNYPEKDSPYPYYLLSGEKLPDVIGLAPSYIPNEDKSISIDTTKGYRREYSERIQGPLRNANVCQINGDDPDQDCSCDYIKVEYKDGSTDYWPQRVDGQKESIKNVIPQGICSGYGENAGRVCSNDADCVVQDNSGNIITPGTCSKVKTQTYNYGLKGLCLEYDRSRPIGIVRDETKLYDSFACLTWLPIEVSASKIDIYNADQGAGYDISQDAQPGGFGQLYCLNATRDGDYYDGAYGSQPNASKIEIGTGVGYFNFSGGTGNIVSQGLRGLYLVDDDVDCDFFDWKAPAGKKYAGKDSSCGGEATRLNLSCSIIDNAELEYKDTNKIEGDYNGKKNVSKFVAEACNNDMHDVYETMQAWAWKIYGDNAIVLRMDGKTNMSFAPVLGEGIVSSGNPVLPSTQTTFQSKYTSSFEQYLHESDIEQLCFVPMGFPGGHYAYDFLPALMEDRICISFQDVKDGDSKNGSLQAITAASVDLLDHADETKGIFDYNEYFTDDDEDIGFNDGQVEFPLDRSENSAYVWTYFEKKDASTNRYVAVIYDNTDPSIPATDTNSQAAIEGFPSRVSDLSNNTLVNPFSVQLSPSQKNWLAIAADFDAVTGKFLGYTSRFYHGYKGGSGMRFATIATLYNQCVDAVEVYDNVEPITGDTNKAWTEKTWSEYAFELRNTNYAPYGSLPYVNTDIDNDVTLRKISFFDGPKTYKSGTALSCLAQWGGLPTVGAAGCIITADSLYNVDSGPSDTLHTIFAKFYTRKIFNPTNQGFQTQNDLDVSDELAGTEPPKIFATNPLTCAGDSNCRAAQENAFTLNGRNYIIADYDGDGVNEEDSNKNGRVDPIIAEGSIPVTAKFFAYADDNHMPLRRIMVDWNDGKYSNDQTKGLYKNRKPYCGGDSGQQARCLDTDGSATQLTCDSADSAAGDRECVLALGDGASCNTDTIAANFGDATRACKESNFEFFHMYYCDAGSNNLVSVDSLNNNTQYFPSAIDGEEAYARLIERGLSDDDQVCVFKPKVQVLDNWGWCNGDCGPDGCYEKAESFGSINNECSSDSEFAWTEYKGYVIVIPPQ